MKAVQCLMVVLGVLRVFGQFPCTWNSTYTTFKYQKCLLGWTVVYGSVAAGLVILSLVVFEPEELGSMSQVMQVSFGVLIRSWNVTVFCLITHAIYMHSDLTKVLEDLFTHSKLTHYNLNRTRVVLVSLDVLMYLVDFGNICVLQITVYKELSIFNAIVSIINHIVLEATVFLHPVLIYFLLKLLAFTLREKLLPYEDLAQMANSKGQMSELNKDTFYLRNPTTGPSTTELHTVRTDTVKSEEPEDQGRILSDIPDVTELMDFIVHFNAVTEAIMKLIQFPVVVLLLNEMLYLTIICYYTINSGYSSYSSKWSGFCFSFSSLLRVIYILSSPVCIIDQVSLIHILICRVMLLFIYCKKGLHFPLKSDFIFTN